MITPKILQKATIISSYLELKQAKKKLKLKTGQLSDRWAANLILATQVAFVTTWITGTVLSGGAPEAPIAFGTIILVITTNSVICEHKRIKKQEKNDHQA